MQKFKNLIRLSLMALLLVQSSTPAFARLIFADDVFLNKSETYEIGADDDAALNNLLLKFGNNNPEYVEWNTSAFTITDDVTIEGNQYIQGTGIMLDSDNTGVGEDLQIVANQGSDNNGTLQYNSTTNLWELSNDSGSFVPISSIYDIDLDDAYDNFGTSPSTITVDAAEGQTGGLKFTGSLVTDETVTITNSGNGGGLMVENTGSGLTFRVNDMAADITPFVIDNDGDVGLGTATPTFNFHLFDSTNPTTTIWQVFDDGTNQVSILTGTQNPKITATYANTGSIFLNSDTGEFYVKIDDGMTTNWYLAGISNDIWGALEGTYGIPSNLNKFVTDDDPRLSQNTGAFGETALGTRLDYETVNFKLDNTIIYYTRIFLPSSTFVECIATFTTQSRNGNINFGIYSDNNGPETKLVETGTQTGVTSPTYGFWEYFLASPYEITTAGFYWLAMATTATPKATTYSSADDRFIPYRIEEKTVPTTTLPTTATPETLGNTTNLPYIAAFE